jgi:hypothetical protein
MACQDFDNNTTIVAATALIAQTVRTSIPFIQKSQVALTPMKSGQASICLALLILPLTPATVSGTGSEQ